MNRCYIILYALVRYGFVSDILSVHSRWKNMSFTKKTFPRQDALIFYENMNK